jgi:hypothetical protein
VRRAEKLAALLLARPTNGGVFLQDPSNASFRGLQDTAAVGPN